MDTSPQIDQLVATCDGVAVARVQMQNIVIIDGPGDADRAHKFINVQDGERMVTFLLDRRECRHLAQLLLNDAGSEVRNTAVAAAPSSLLAPQPGTAIVSLVEHLMNAAFGHARTHRSKFYKEGAEDTLKRLAYGSTSRRRYTPGTPEFDAYHSGANEGYAIWSARRSELLRAEAAQ